MKLLMIFLLALIPLLLTQQAGPTILYVSDSPSAIVSPAYSSLRGGHLIYLQVTGHDPMASGNLVYVGTYPCIIPADGVTDTFIACETTDTGSNIDIYNLPVTLISYFIAYTTGYPDVVHFTTSTTPQLVELFPTSGHANRMVNFYGSHKITDLGDGRSMGDVVKLLLGQDLCSRFDVVQQPIDKWANQYIQCIESSLQVAGKYNISEKLTPGYANLSYYIQRPTLVQGESFAFTALPTVASISPTNGNLGGQIVTVSGTGFSQVLANNTVTVGGNSCTVTASTEQQLTCTLAPKNNNLTSLLSTTSTSQANGYFSGAGLTYSRYGIAGTQSLSTFVAAVRGKNTTFLGTPQETGFRSQLKEGNVYGSQYGQVWTGYFTAPATGTYVFRGLADDAFSFYISSVSGSTEPSLTPLIKSDTNQPYWNNFYIDDSPLAEASISLTAGKSYYIQAYHLNYQGGGYFRVEADVPNSDTTLTFQAYEVNKIITNTTITPETVTYSMNGGSSGSINLRLVRSDSNGLITYNVNTTVAYGCQATAFQSALNSFNSFNGYRFTVTRTIYSGSNVINTTVGATKIDYEVSILLLRSAAYTAEDFIYTYLNYTGTMTRTLGTAHSPLISGTFSLSVGGQQFNAIPYNASASTIQSYFNSLVGYQMVKVDQYSQYGYGYANTWIIRYIGVNGAVPNATVNGAGLSGGAGTPTIQIIIRRQYSSSITFSPIDYRFLNTFSSQANVLVTTNGVPAICVGNCGYSFGDYTSITALSQNGTVLLMAIHLASNVSAPLSTITILVQGLPCAINPSSTVSALSCTLTTNPDGTPTLVAGIFVPAVYINPLGYAGLASGVNPITVPLITTSLRAPIGGNNGGYYNTLYGSGFPQDRSKVSITVCGSRATIISSTNKAVVFYQPSCTSLNTTQAITVQVGTISDSSQAFTYINGSLTAPTISSISPTSQNPAVKGILTISGSGFGADQTAIRVFLSNSSGRAYQLNVLSVSNTSVKVGLSGGQAGTFTVQVTLPNTTGNSIASAGADQFQYLCSITSVSPSSGSYNGGTLLTISGTNFSPAYSDTLVYIGDTLNWFCNIQTITSTQITCRTPAISRFYSAGQSLKVVVSTKLFLFNSCPGNNCSFSYISNASSPQLVASSASIANAPAVITLNGTNFISSVTCSVSITSATNNSLQYSTTSNCTNTGATFAVPKSIPAGDYLVKVRNQIGQSNGLALQINWVPGTANYSSGGGSVMGNVIAFTGGSGYPASLGSGYNILLSDGSNTLPLSIISCCTNNTLIFAIPAAPTNTLITIFFNGPVGSTYKTYIYQTSLTPIIILTSTNTLSPGLNTITFTRNDSLVAPITSLNLISTIDASNSNSISTFTNVSKTYTFTTTLNSGSYSIQALTKFGYAQVIGVISVSLAATTASPIVASFAGGLFTVTGSNLSPSSYIVVNSFIGRIQTYSSSAVTYYVPAIITSVTQSAYNLKQVGLVPSSSFTLSSDRLSNITNVTAAFDGDSSTIYGSPNAACWIGIDVGQGLQATVSRFRFFPFLRWANTANYILGGVFEGSNDQSTWSTMATIDQTVHSGWNVITSSDSTPYRYLRFRHTNQSQCNIAQIQLYGIVLSSQTISLASQLSNVIYQDGYNTQNFSSAIQFKQDHTPTVQSVVPPYGDIFGGYSLTITGSNLGFAAVVVLIDNIPCAIISTNSSQIVCTVGARPNIPSSNSFFVTIGGARAIIVNSFLYVLRWSDSRTWGVDLPPIDGDLVYVPVGMTLLVDQNTPILDGIAVENGTLIFPNDTDVIVSTKFITLNGGTFMAGTESAPLYSNLKFVMYGNYYGKQQPMFGNKGIGCLNCKFSMYGKPRTPTWTTISATINPGDNTFSVSQDVDWRVGETIVVASTSFFHYEAEKKNITAISGRIITVDSPFVNKHISVVETYGSGDQLVMRAEVGLLTRNIKMMGDPTSAIGKYGSHLMMAGTYPDGLEGRIAYSEFTHCGQPQILGRYCIHFHMAGEVPTSFVRGNAVHESFARVVTIHGVYLLTIENNVGYRVRGHNFFVEDGIETHNTIRNNLAISSLTVTNMLQTDISVASFWITNPTNDFYGNHAAGGDFYGIWYQIKANPDGPSATNDVCPMGNPLGYVANNVAHSNTRFGLRIFKLFSRKFPCQKLRDDSNASDPWYKNPSIPSIFYNFTIYKNLENGVLAEQTGNVIFSNFTIAENYRSGVEFYLNNFTKEMSSVNNCAIIGKSQTNMASTTLNYTNGMAGVILGRSGQSNITNTRFYNYPVGSIAFKTCSGCDDPDLFTNLGTETFVKNLTFNQVNGNYLFMIGMKRDVIYDLDASLSSAFGGGSRTSGTIMHNFNHISNYQQSACSTPITVAQWDNTIYCDQTVTIRRIYFTNIIDPYVFNAQFMKVKQLTSLNQVVDPATNSALYTSVQSLLDGKFKCMKEKPSTFSLPFVAGQVYQIWWGAGIDFSHLSISTTTLYGPNDPGVLFKFNYTLNREIYNIGPMRGGTLLKPLNYIPENSNQTTFSVNSCVNGEYFHNNDNSSSRMLAICQSGKNRTKFQYTEINAIVCLYHCPAPAGTFIKEGFTRRWSNASQWPNGNVPGPMENVTVNGNWTVLLDVDPAPADYLVIDGALIADDTRDVNITARSIHIRAGNVTIGSPSTPFQHKFTIQISNTKQNHGWYIDPLVAGNKYLIVTGTLNLYGNPPSTVQTFLTKSVFTGDSLIYVSSSTDWAVGDTLALSPSYGIYSQYQSVNITAINQNGSISISPVLKYNHYGSYSLHSTPYGSIDLNAHVAHLNRNIKIVPGPDSGWGVNVLVYGYMDGLIQRVGSINFDGVQLQDGGQYDTTASALQFLNVVNGNYSSTVTASSFVNCKAWCVNINNIKNIAFTNNVFYNGWVFGVQAISIKSFQFTNNLFIGIVERPTMNFGTQLIACFATYQYLNPATDAVTVSNNLCLGSQGHGFAFPHIQCSQLEVNPFAGNTAGSCQIGFIFNNIAAPDGCKAFSYINAYANEIGQICGPLPTTAMVYKNFVMVDNKRGATLKFGGSEGTTNHTGIFTNSYIAAISRPSCSYCYGSTAIPCSNNIGLRMLSVSANGETLPSKFGANFDVICKQQLYESKVYMTNVTFSQFNTNYTLSQCGNNFAFRSHSGAFGSVADHNLFNVKCLNCDTNSYLLADMNSPSQIGWFGGCGDILCTGKSNYLITDWNGTFLGFTGVIIPNNTVIGSNEAGCTPNSHMNAYVCHRTDFATLAYHSTAADFNTRIMWPVSLTYDGANYSTLTNGWREWDWLGKQPQNHRFGRFLSIVKLNSTYNFTFTAQPPINMQFQIQKRTPSGNNSNYIVAKLHYPLPNMIQIKVNGIVMDPVLITDSGLKRNLNVSLCGDNAYFYNNYTTHFVITQDLNCLVEVSLTNTIQLTTHFAMNASDFFTNNYLSSFISNLCALVGITDYSRVKVVGVVSGSTVITTSITDTGNSGGSSSSSGASITQVHDTLNSNSQNIGTSLGAGMGGATFLSLSSIYYPINSSTSSTSQSNVGILLGVTIAAAVLMISIVLIFFHCLRKRAKIVQQFQESSEEIHQDKEFDKDHILANESNFQHLHHISEIKRNLKLNKELDLILDE